MSEEEPLIKLCSHIEEKLKDNESKLKEFHTLFKSYLIMSTMISELGLSQEYKERYTKLSLAELKEVSTKC